MYLVVRGANTSQWFKLSENVAKNLLFRQHRLIVMLSEITEKECDRESYPTGERKLVLYNIAQPSQQ